MALTRDPHNLQKSIPKPGLTQKSYTLGNALQNLLFNAIKYSNGRPVELDL
jgi:signal transduction histidine kinase